MAKTAKSGRRYGNAQLFFTAIQKLMPSSASMSGMTMMVMEEE